jgi:hypothetical protein
VSVADQIRAIAGLRRAEAASAAPAEEPDEADTPARLARLETESGIPIVAFAAIAEIVTLLLMSEEDMP